MWELWLLGNWFLLMGFCVVQLFCPWPRGPILVPSLTRKRAKEGDALVKLLFGFAVKPELIILVLTYGVT